MDVVSQVNVRPACQVLDLGSECTVLGIKSRVYHLFATVALLSVQFVTPIEKGVCT